MIAFMIVCNFTSRKWCCCDHGYFISCICAISQTCFWPLENKAMWPNLTTEQWCAANRKWPDGFMTVGCLHLTPFSLWPCPPWHLAWADMKLSPGEAYRAAELLVWSPPGCRRECIKRMARLTLSDIRVKWTCFMFHRCSSYTSVFRLLVCDSFFVSYLETRTQFGPHFVYVSYIYDDNM